MNYSRNTIIVLSLSLTSQVQVQFKGAQKNAPRCVYLNCELSEKGEAFPTEEPQKVLVGK